MLNNQNSNNKIEKLLQWLKQHFDVVLIIFIVAEMLIIKFAIGKSFGFLINWEEYYTLLLLTFAIAPIITLGKIDIAINQIGLFTAIILSYYCRNMNISYNVSSISIGLLVILTIIALWKKPTNKKLIPILLSLTILIPSVWAIYNLTGERFVLGLISFIGLSCILLTYYLIIFKERNSLVGSLIVYFILVGLIGIIFSEMTKNYPGMDRTSIHLVDKNLFSPLKNWLIFLALIIIFLLIHWEDLMIKFQKSKLPDFFDISAKKKPFYKFYNFFLTINDNLKYIKAIGSNKRTSEYYGINIAAYTFYAYTISLVFIVFFGIYAVTMNNGFESNSFANYNLYAIALAVIAGINLEGGVIYFYRIPIVTFMWANLLSIFSGLGLSQSYASFAINIIIGIAIIIILLAKKEKEQQFISIFKKTE